MQTVLSSTDWVLVIVATFLIGMGKGGLKGIDMLNVTIMAIVFGSKTSTGIVLPLLLCADIAAVAYYRRFADWALFWKLAPWMIIGVLLGVFLGKDMHELLFRKIMSGIVLVTIVIVLIMELRKDKEVPNHPAFAIGNGLAAGFTTMIGNLAGAFANLYFLAMRVNKNVFIGTGAWVFLFMNWFKFPFQVFYWKNINGDTLQIDLYLLPVLLLGFWAGVKVVDKIKDEHFRKLVIVLTILGSSVMLLKS
jgi:uncharacterized membrane protein YfcA